MLLWISGVLKRCECEIQFKINVHASLGTKLDSAEEVKDINVKRIGSITLVDVSCTIFVAFCCLISECISFFVVSETQMKIFRRFALNLRNFQSASDTGS